MAHLNSSLVTDIIRLEQWADLGRAMDQAELESTVEEPLSLWPCAMHLLAHIYSNNLADARMLYRRIPPAVKQVNDPQLNSAIRILQHLWHQDYQGVWHVLASTAWRDEEKPLATALHAKLQQQALQLVAKAYANIHVEQAAVIVGMTPQQLLAKANELGWRLDAEHNVLCIDTAPSQKSTEEDAAAYERGHQQLKQLTDYVVHFQANAGHSAV